MAAQGASADNHLCLCVVLSHRPTAINRLLLNVTDKPHLVPPGAPLAMLGQSWGTAGLVGDGGYPRGKQTSSRHVCDTAVVD